MTKFISVEYDPFCFMTTAYFLFIVDRYLTGSTNKFLSLRVQDGDTLLYLVFFLTAFLRLADAVNLQMLVITLNRRFRIPVTQKYVFLKCICLNTVDFILSIFGNMQ